MKDALGKFLAYTCLVFIVLFTMPALAGFQGYNGSSDLKIFNKLQCSAAGGLTCAKVGDKMTIGVSVGHGSTAPMTRFSSRWMPAAVTSGTSTTPSATTLYLTQINIPYSVTLTGINVLNAATVGTNKYIVALYNSAGVKLANSALAGVLTAGASGYQAVPFTATYTVLGPGTYWVGLFVDGTTDRFYSIPAVGAIGGLAGSVTGQTFGTVGSSVTLPTTFTADKGPIVFTY